MMGKSHFSELPTRRSSGHRGTRGREARHLLAGGFAGALALAGALLLVLPLPAAASVESELAFHRGVVAYGEGRLEEARRHFLVVVGEEPADAASLQYLGLIAHAQGDTEAAVEYLRAAADAAPQDPEIRVDLAAALLAAGRADEAETALGRVLAEDPDHARAHLYQGVADYRQREYGEALPHFRRAEEIDPSLRLESRYYVGLTEAFLGNLGASGDAFADAQEESPNHPLGRSARALRVQIDPGADQKRWAAGVLAGLEFDSNPTVVGEEVFQGARPVDGDEDPDGRGVLRLKGEVEALRTERASLRAGYDGYFNFHFDETEVDQNTQVGWLAGEALFDPVRVGLRYDYGFTWLDLDDEFRSLHRLTPSASLRNADWGISQIFYEWQHLTYVTEIDGQLANAALDRDGDLHSVGVNQFVFLPRPLSYARAGFTWSHFDPEGSEFEHDAYEVSAGLAAALPWNIDAALLYRFTYRDYDNASFFDLPDRTEKRDDYASRLTVDVSVPFADHWRASLAGSFTFNPSDVDFYDYDRQIVGMYLAYDF